MLESIRGRRKKAKKRPNYRNVDEESTDNGAAKPGNAVFYNEGQESTSEQPHGESSKVEGTYKTNSSHHGKQTPVAIFELN